MLVIVNPWLPPVPGASARTAACGDTLAATVPVVT